MCQTYVSGSIRFEGPRYLGEAKGEHNRMRNRKALDALPEIDAHPYLSRHMFSFTPQNQSYKDSVIVMYGVEVPSVEYADVGRRGAAYPGQVLS